MRENKKSINVCQIRWMGYEWLKQEHWGRVHPDKPNKYNCYECVRTVDNQLILSIMYKPTTITERVLDADSNQYVDKTFNPKFGFGLVTCQTKFGYGTFEIEAKLPTGKNICPSFWLYPWDNWPPEIDVFEGYTNKQGKYLKFGFKKWCHNIRQLFRWDLQSNYHVYSSDGSKHVNGWSLFDNLKKEPSDHFIKYKLLWTPTKLEFWYDNKKIRTVTDPNIINTLNKYQKLKVIINNTCTPNYNMNDLLTYDQDFLINSFEYTPLYTSYDKKQSTH